MKHDGPKRKKANEKPVTQEELLSQIDNWQTFLYMHGYQPPRRLKIDEDTVFDITGESDLPGGYNERIWDNCYHLMTTPITQYGIDNPDAVLSNELAAGHLFGTTRDWIKEFHPSDYEQVIEILGMSEIPFVDPYLHPILPLLPEILQEIMIDIGIKAWEEDFGVKLVNTKGEPLIGFGFWPPELGVNKQTVDLLAKKGVRFLILDQEQLDFVDYKPIYKVPTPSGDVLVFGYNGWEFARKLAFSDISNSDNFVKKIRKYKDNHHFPPLAAMDMETFGEWRGETSMWFLNYFVHQGMHPDEFKRNQDMIGTAGIKDATSWSCPHALGRWTGKNNCGCDGANDELRKRKQALYEGLRGHLDQTVEELQGIDDWYQTFINFFINNRNNLATGKPVLFENIDVHYRQPFKKLYLGLVGMTSCGWFYAGELERQIPENCLKWLEGMEK